MELYILDESFNKLYLLDLFESLLWIERYWEYGDFEIYTPTNDEILKVAKTVLDKRRNDLDCYVTLKESEQVMVIEEMEVTTDSDLGSRIIISGRSLESILDRRIIWPQLNLDSKIQTAIKRLLFKNVIDPDDEGRIISNFIFEESDDEVFESMEIRAQYTGDNLYDTISEICKEYKIGFQVKLINKKFVFKLYRGVDRSFSQIKNSRVIFSPEFENIVDSKFVESAKNLRNIAVVAGEDSENGRRFLIIGDKIGLKRRELYVDARDIQSENEDGSLISDEEYYEKLNNRGNSKLTDYKYVNTFEGQVETEQQFLYGRDFFKGDIVQLMTEYGLGGEARITEFIRSYDETGYNVYPTFEMVEEEE